MSVEPLHQYQREYLDRVEAALHEIPEGARQDAVQYARRLMLRELPVIFDQRHLAHVAGIDSQVIGTIRRNPARFYTAFRIAKRSGASRLIQAPSPALKTIQFWLQRHVTSGLKPHQAAHGFVRGRSIVTNALPHVRAPVVLKLDVRDFFGTVQREVAYRAFRFLGYSRDVSHLFTELTTLDDSLPQGAPTSPDLANYAAYRLDVRLAAFAAKHQLRYTRYADDLTFSGQIHPPEQRTVQLIIRDEGFMPNEAKARYVLPDQRQQVTGIVVNDRANWPRSRRRWLRQEVYFLRRYGPEEHIRRRAISQARYKEFIYGHIFALHAVRPEEATGLLEDLDRVQWPY